jgi:hypothetical protein
VWKRGQVDPFRYSDIVGGKLERPSIWQTFNVDRIFEAAWAKTGNAEGVVPAHKLPAKVRGGLLLDGKGSAYISLVHLAANTRQHYLATFHHGETVGQVSGEFKILLDQDDGHLSCCR